MPALKVSPHLSLVSAANARLTPSATLTVPDFVHPWELQTLLSHVAPNARLLSLDCFDTILVRRTRTPVDVFYDLQNHPTLKRFGISAKTRAQAESMARSLLQVKKGRTEADLAAIYRVACPDATEAEISELRAAELETEIAACNPFAPTVALMEAAKDRGLPIIVVSDTYFSEQELRTLLQARLPEKAYQAISRIYASSAYGRSKVGGLFDDVVASEQLKAERIVHLGDNPLADYHAGRRKGLCSVELRYDQPEVAEVLRLSASAGLMLEPKTRGQVGLPCPWHGFLNSKQQDTSPSAQLGYLGAGPIMYAFAKYIESTLSELRQQHQSVKPVFLMRDAYLPQLVFESLDSGEKGRALSISRFAAYAASFVDQASIESYLARSAGSLRFPAMIRQLGLTEKQRSLIETRLKKANDPGLEFIKQVLRPEIVTTILEHSAKYRSRLYKYLERELDLKSGDTLLFIDLGYEGTAQRQLAPVFLAERDVTVRGCYLIAASVPGWEKDRTGLLDPSHVDDRAAHALIPYVALLEDLCTAHMNSLVDYTDDGDPIWGEQIIDQAQFDRILPVQEHAVRFAQEAESYFSAVGAFPPLSDLRYGALAALGRLLFFPSQSEVNYLDGFRLDMGLGTIDSFALFDRAKGLDGLKKRGLFFMEQNHQELRMNYPIELRHAGLELSMTLLAQHRFGCEFSQRDLSQRTMKVPLLVVSGDDASVAEAEAQATYDGCFSLAVPVGDCTFDLGLIFAKKLKWMQLISVEMIAQSVYLKDKESQHTLDLTPEIILENALPHGDGLVSFSSDEGFIYISPRKHRRDETPQVVRVVFRPLVEQTQIANDIS